jgi:hypothetical protein
MKRYADCWDKYSLYNPTSEELFLRQKIDIQLATKAIDIFSKFKEGTCTNSQIGIFNTDLIDKRHIDLYSYIYFLLIIYFKKINFMIRTNSEKNLSMVRIESNITDLSKCFKNSIEDLSIKPSVESLSLSTIDNKLFNSQKKMAGASSLKLPFIRSLELNIPKDTEDNNLIIICDPANLIYTLDGTIELEEILAIHRTCILLKKYSKAIFLVTKPIKYESFRKDIFIFGSEFDLDSIGKILELSDRDYVNDESPLKESLYNVEEE